MSFSTQMAELVGKQLSKFATSNPHQLAGQANNLAFWLGEVGHALDVIDGYSARFERLKSAQTKYVTDHNTIDFILDDPCCKGTAEPPRRVSHEELREARRYLCDSTYRFLVRCCNEDMISETDLRAACAKFDIGVERRDLKLRV